MCLIFFMQCYYSYYMKTIMLKVNRIGNSRGVRLPADSIRRYGIADTLIMEERSDGLLLRTPGPAVEKLSWADTAREMAGEKESWDDWSAVTGDGLDEIPWGTGSSGKAAANKAAYRVKRSKGKRP